MISCIEPYHYTISEIEKIIKQISHDGFQIIFTKFVIITRDKVVIFKINT